MSLNWVLDAYFLNIKYFEMRTHYIDLSRKYGREGRKETQCGV